jgi:hypothetical protein
VIWIVDAVGEPKAVQQRIEGLAKTAFQGKRYKMLRPADLMQDIHEFSSGIRDEAG